VPVDVGQPEVEYDQVRPVVKDVLERDHAGSGTGDGMAELTQRPDECAPDVRIVLYQQEL
jgi:hypothetical protein